MTEFPILLLDNFFLFPRCDNFLPLENNIYWKKVLLQAWKDCKGYLLVIPNKEKFAGNSEEKFVPLGTLAKINLDITTDDLEPILNSFKEIQLRGLERIRVNSLDKRGEIWHGKYQVLSEKELDERSLDELTEKFVRHLPDILEKSKLSAVDKLPYMTMMRGNVSNIIDFIAQNSREIDQLTKWKILASLDLQERLDILINLPDRRKIDEDLEKETKEEIKKQQEEWYLREKQKAIERRLKKSRGYGSGEMKKYLERLEKEPYPDYVKKVAYEEIERYEVLHPSSSEAGMIRNYIDWLTNIPWWQRTTETRDLAKVRHKLTENHYGLKEVKEKICEYLAASWSAKEGESASKNLLLYGPPGVGKTSIAKSIADALGIPFLVFSAAGVNDVSIIKGHIRTYVGAMPGRIMQLVKKAGDKYFFLFIDELDKIGQDSWRGNPAYALLEVLDPQQNKKFIDNYLGEEVPYDLSKVIIICAANDPWKIPAPLLDRMEMIHLSSYTEVEKFHIAKDYSIPAILEKYRSITKREGGERIKFTDEAIKYLIRSYTRESGVRELKRKIETVVQKFIVQFIQGEKEELIVTPENLLDYLKKPDYEFTKKRQHPEIGAATGLAWTGYGGDILPIEVAYYPRKEGEPEFTGNLGDIMKESCTVALDYIRANCEKFGIDPKKFSQNKIRIHAVEGAVPKEGPSAGIALTSAIISALTNQAISTEVGMTGEITLHGHVEPIGGLKEKAIAAHRSGLKTIIIPKANEKDIDDIPEEVRQNLEIITVDEYEKVWKILFAKKSKKSVFPIKKRSTPKVEVNP
ncbi:MAG: class III heat-shock ATP-dependent LonA protease [Mycoplasmataceae bacterium RV_VA103A]|nr:MAG: class III heat-shock ATP-dependent LonA protease [Mycoplasmataceae bacterium RV_VA103A]